ncbi:MAG TPA: lytic murein transglycosylase [Nevskiaceae bacterium]
MIRLIAAAVLLACSCAAWADFSDAPRVPVLLEQLQARYGFTASQLNDVRATLRGAQLMPQLLHEERHAKEKTLAWSAYRKIAVNARNVTAGLAFMHENQRWLDKAEAIYGVPPSVITAILGVETRYGRNTGHVRTIDALSTMAFEHDRRSDFFFSELEQFFVLCRDDGLDPSTVQGSYAGALGMAQFMPSNYRRLAVDFDGSGTANLWSAPDAIGSIANYLVHYDPVRRWQRGMPIMLPATAPGRLPADVTVNPRQIDSLVGSLEQGGIRSASGVVLPASLPAAFVRLDGAGTQQADWMVLSPFYAIMSYNPRIFYAMAVSQLAQELAHARRGDR